MTMDKGPTRGSKLIFWAIGWMSVVPLVSSFGATWLLYRYEPLVQVFDHVSWLAFYIGASITMAFALTPTTYIAVVSGYFLGYLGIPYLVVAYQAASIWGFLLSRKLDNGVIDQLSLKYPKVQQTLERLKANEIMAIILARISPALPFALMNVVLAIANVRLNRFFIGGLIGMLPRSLFFVWVGIQASKLSEAIENRDHIHLSILLVLVAGVGLYLILKPNRQSSK